MALSDHPQPNTPSRAQRVKTASEADVTNDHANLTNVTTDQHHTKNHAAAHAENAADELFVENLGTAGAANRVPKSNGSGGLAMGQVAHSELSGTGTDDHHAESHASRHLPGNADSIDFSAITDILASGDIPELSISAGAITITRNVHSVDTESDAASDDLDTINGGAIGQLLALRAVSPARVVTLKSATGNLLLPNNQDIALDSQRPGLILVYDGTWWRVMGTAMFDQATSTPSLRSLGTGAQQAAAGDHGHGTIPSQAVQADIEGETNEDTYIPPDLARHIPGAAKAYCTVASNGGLAANSYNIASVVKNGTGNYTVNFTTNFSNSNYACVVTTEDSGNEDTSVVVQSPASDSIQILTLVAGSLTDYAFHLVAFGDQ